MLPRLCWPPIPRVAIRSRSKPNMTVWLISKHPCKSTDLKGAKERASSFRRRKEQKERKKRPSRIKGKISLRIFRFGTRPLYLLRTNMNVSRRTPPYGRSAFFWDHFTWRNGDVNIWKMQIHINFHIRICGFSKILLIFI